jgi:beta-barrel assembly-enhancing protease
MMKANAFAQGRSLAGVLEVTPEIVRFTAGAETIEMPLSGLKLTRGGHNREHIFLEHAAQPGWSVTTNDPQFLKHPNIAGHTELAPSVRTLPREHRGRGLAIASLVLIGLLLGIVIALVASRDWIVKKIADRIPVSWEMKMGEQFFSQIQGEGKLIADVDRSNRVVAITKPLLEAVGETGYTFRFHIVNDTNINAFAVPGGHIFIHTGLLAAADTPEEIAGVLGHEIAHVTERHGFRSIINTAGLYLIVQFLLGDTSGLAAVLADGSQMLLRQRYSRDFERQADDVGWRYLIRANIDPRGMIRFFDRLKKEEQKYPQLRGSLQLFNTHPATDERMKRLEEKWKKLDRKDGFRTL